MTLTTITTQSRAPQELRTIHDFTDEFLVVCPRCSRKADVTPSTEERSPRFSCLHCGLVRQWTSDKKGVLFSQQPGNWPEAQKGLSIKGSAA